MRWKNVTFTAPIKGLYWLTLVWSRKSCKFSVSILFCWVRLTTQTQKYNQLSAAETIQVSFKVSQQPTNDFHICQRKRFYPKTEDEKQSKQVQTKKNYANLVSSGKNYTPPTSELKLPGLAANQKLSISPSSQRLTRIKRINEEAYINGSLTI